MPQRARTGQSALRYVLKEAQKAGIGLSHLLQGNKQERPVRHIKGVHKGRFYRKRIKEEAQPPPTVPKLPPIGPQTVPHPLKHAVPPPHHVPPHGHGPPTPPTLYERSVAWLKQNAAVLVLNFGSVCTLIGFTKSDVLELRAFSMSGSTCSVLYFLLNHPIRWAPIAWSGLFAAVNGFNIYKIIYERTAKVMLTEEEERTFVEHFMPHGVTPKQFEKITRKATTKYYKKGEVIVKQGDPLTSVYLVLTGKTRASYLGRRLTAVSSAPGYRERKKGGDSGAWIGEMTFLEAFGQKEMKGDDEEDVLEGRRLGDAIYTITAETDCEVLVWTHKDIEDLMRQSTDLRAAMTRAMTAPIVGKVINFTVAMGKPTWSTWLDDWKGASVHIVNKDVKMESEEEGSDVEVEPVM